VIEHGIALAAAGSHAAPSSMEAPRPRAGGCPYPARRRRRRAHRPRCDAAVTGNTI